MLKLRLTMTQLGPLNALLYWCNQVLVHLSGQRCGIFRYYFVAQPVRLHDLAPCPTSRFEFKLHVCDTPLLLQAPRPQRVLQQRFAQGACCLSAQLDGELVAYLWFVPHCYIEDEVRAHYLLESADSAWDFDVWVAPDYRLGPLFARLWQQAHIVMAQRRLNWSYSRICAFNQHSLRTHQHLHLHRLGVATFLRLGCWQCMIADVAPYFHCSLSGKSQPRFHFNTRLLAL